MGNQFKLLIFDEIHHLPASSWHEIALMCAAPYRLGLTATYWVYPKVQLAPFTLVENDPAQLSDNLVGPVVYRKKLDDLTGVQLAEYRTERIRVDLTPEEREAYDAAYAIYIGSVHVARLRESHGPRGSSNAREYIQQLGRLLRKRGNAQVILYEIIAHKTVDEGIARRRRSQRD